MNLNPKDPNLIKNLAKIKTIILNSCNKGLFKDM